LTPSQLLVPFSDRIHSPYLEEGPHLAGRDEARGRRTVIVALRMIDLHQLAQFNVFHHMPPSSPLGSLADEQSALPVAGPYVCLFLVVLLFSWSWMKRMSRRQGRTSANVVSTMIWCILSLQAPKMSRGLRWLCLMLTVSPAWTRRA
jgi:hypothetical protein